MLNRSAMAELENAWERVQSLQERISSGRRILRPSDDPSGTDRTMMVTSDTRINDQYARTLEESRRFVESSESAMDQLVEIGIQVNTISVQVADGSYGPDHMTTLASQLNALLEEAVALGNSEYGGMRLFGGQATRTEPFTIERNDKGDISVVKAESIGAEKDIQRQVSDHLLLTINQTGSDLFGEDLEFFSDLVSLRDAALEADHDGAEKMISQVSDNLDRLNLARSVTGALYTRIDNQIKWTETQNLELEAIRSEFEDLDMVEAMMDYQREQAILEAALSTTSQTLRLSLVNYMQ